MRFSLKWIAVTGMLLWTFSAHAVLTIEITRGVDTGTPIAIVPFSWEGSGKPPQIVSDVVEADLARSGRFAVMPRMRRVRPPSSTSTFR